MRKLRLVFLAGAALIGLPAFAAAPFKLVPDHDLTGTYQVTKPGKPTQTLSVEYSAEARLAKIVPSNGRGYILFDLASKDAKMVMPSMQKYVDQPALAQRAAATQASVGGTGGSDNVTVTTQGTKTIAGHDCTIYKSTDTTRGTSSTLCVTSDNVLLELTSSDGADILAQSVSYDTVPVADVTLPPGYTQLEIPQMPGMPGMGGAPGMGGGMPMQGMPGMAMPGSAAGQ